ncbi:MAG TPA: hypothetical protein VLB32_07135 [Candidatus Acidoferrales bacterium]|nr:hypothetical protein [Candidatus Acidoferrales bacterium]
MSFVSSENGAGTGRVLRRYYGRLYRHFGPQRWWPARTRFEVILGALLTQNTSWANVEKALNNLRREDLLSPARLSRVRVPRLERLLRPSGYFRQKTRAVRHFLGHLQNHYAGSLRKMLSRPAAELRDELLDLNGIGEETADSMLLYAAGRPVFVIDAYTRRVISRHGLASERATYGELQDVFHRHLPRRASLFNEYHALLVLVGKGYCHRQEPNCDACPLGPELERSRGGL